MGLKSSRFHRRSDASLRGEASVVKETTTDAAAGRSEEPRAAASTSDRGRIGVTGEPHPAVSVTQGPPSGFLGLPVTRRKERNNSRLAIRSLADDVLPFVDEEACFVIVRRACAPWRRAVDGDMERRARDRRTASFLRGNPKSGGGDATVEARQAAYFGDVNFLMGVASALHSDDNPRRHTAAPSPNDIHPDHPFPSPLVGGGHGSCLTVMARWDRRFASVVACAILGGNVPTVEYCLAHGGGGRGFRTVAIPCAIMSGELSMLRYILEDPVPLPLNSTDASHSRGLSSTWDGVLHGEHQPPDIPFSATQLAAYSGSLSMLQYCVAHGGGEVSERATTVGANQNALHIAAACGHPTLMLDCLVRACGRSVMHLLRRDGCAITLRPSSILECDARGFTIAHLAARSGNVVAFRIALSRTGHMLGRVAHCGETVVYCARMSGDADTIAFCAAVEADEREHRSADGLFGE